ncbi:glycosyl transferase family 2 [Rippkaea orientalis PCC 8801]|uniref:Glycosyl transferase family 2 n=1 Tax=Rippkaea orientalis (strain PCC 8801 / RF-1) TaxID=41431 RepID=B7JZ87_RIPO1|nr:glycosyltransferase family 2 protein [Rippkaea orientalis]ACK67298.1 glycosyl transferase family 2 [Rippkaea orientalis PCC 8801]
MNHKKLISVLTPCYNEEKNIEEVYLKVKEIFEEFEEYDYEHIFIDNASSDKTVSILKSIASKDPRIKIIINARNFGVIRSYYYGLLQAYGDAVVLIFADLQEPPSLIKEFIKKWEEGYKVVQAVKTFSEENYLLFTIKKLYYYFLGKVSEVELSGNTSGFGLYDQTILNVLRQIDDPYPYFKGLISEIGFDKAKIPYTQNKRKRGVSAMNFYKLYDYAMLGITSHSKVPLRLATMVGFSLSVLCCLLAIGTFVAKLLFWNYFPIGIAALIIGVFFLSSVQLFFIGMIGEYIGLMNMRMLKRPLVIERERINF